MGTVAERFEEIHKDLEANITRIYMRRDLLTAIDLVFHSVLRFKFQGHLLKKGWVEALVVGDTRCGKTESVERILGHYRAGELVTGENASFAGLVGGMQQSQKMWSITWGKMPINDKRMIAIDEAGGLGQEIISKLSSIRSSGVAEITKIQNERTNARVRLLWLSNPRGRQSLSEYNRGTEAIQELIGKPEDIARFDFAMTVASNEVPSHVINAYDRPIVEHKYTSEMCHNLVAWAWSRKPEHVVFSKDATMACLELASEMGRRYSSTFPIVEGAEQRIKLARLAVSAACRTFSTEDGEHVLVGAEHVEFVFTYLNEIYCKPSMAYDLYSATKFEERKLEAEEEVVEMIKGHGYDFVNGLQNRQFFTTRDFQDLMLHADASGEGAKILAGFLVRKNCIVRGKTGYRKLPAFINLLRRLVDDYHRTQLDTKKGQKEPTLDDEF